MRFKWKLALGQAVLMSIAIHGISRSQTDAGGGNNAYADSGRVLSKSVLPIAMYDSDIGFGFGAKAVIKNLRTRDSYDWIVFGSTLGEQWYAFAFSHPDNTLRHGTIFPIALDIKIEYDKLLKSNFFGLGNSTGDNDFRFPRESFLLKGAISRAIGRTLTGALTARIAHFSAYGFGDDWPWDISAVLGTGESWLFGLGTSIEYDSRDKIINPGRGNRAELKIERAVKFEAFDWDFWKSRIELSAYRTIFRNGNVLAARLWAQKVSAGAPFQELSKIGDGWTARGYKAGRFLDRAMALASLEYRFPIYRKLGGVAFADAGRVWPALRDFSIHDWHADGGFGLRFYMANFVGRLDIGRSHEGTRIFFNFGHVF
jgi:hypothetical protein